MLPDHRLLEALVRPDLDVRHGGVLVLGAFTLRLVRNLVKKPASTSASRAGRFKKKRILRESIHFSLSVIVFLFLRRRFDTKVCNQENFGKS